MSEPIPANKACDSDAPQTDALLQMLEEMIREGTPNLLRLYRNPWVAQACLVLAELVRHLFSETVHLPRFPSFLANSGEEALSGALKLARFTIHKRLSQTSTRPPAAVALHHQAAPPAFAHFKPADAPHNEGVVCYLPDVYTLSDREFSLALRKQIPEHGIAVLSAATLLADSQKLTQDLRTFQQNDGLVVITVRLSDMKTPELLQKTADFVPDIVVCDDSMTDGLVPFGAFTAQPRYYSAWTKKKMSTFHSTTYQPNTISTRYLVNCMSRQLPEFSQRLQQKLTAILSNPKTCRQVFSDLFSPSLSKTITAAGFDQDSVSVAGHFVNVGSRRLFDGIGGVACSLRGHNPQFWVEEIRRTPVSHDRLEIQEHLFSLTGLPHHVPAVSGGAAVESALKLALIALQPRTHILVLKGGFAGKTLLALAGTERPFYRNGLDPLYPHVIYVDPFAEDAVLQLENAVRFNPIAIVQLELIQGVGGVRAVPQSLLNRIRQLRDLHGFVVFADEIQTGMFRTGPFVRSSATQLDPDLMTIGKGTSDMMFPFALTLYSDRIASLLQKANCPLPDQLRRTYGYETGYRCLLNTLSRCRHSPVEKQVLYAGDQYHNTLTKLLASNPLVKDIRIFGLLIGIQLDLRNTLPARIGLNAAQLILLQMMHHSDFPVLMGYCQYEPETLKFTPPLTVRTDEIASSCAAIAETLHTSPLTLIRTGLRALIRSGIPG